MCELPCTVIITVKKGNIVSVVNGGKHQSSTCLPSSEVQ